MPTDGELRVNPEAPHPTLPVGGRLKRVIPGDRTEPLPPPGDARRDELKARQDNLESKLATIMDAMGLDDTPAKVPISLQEMSVDNEIGSRYDLTRVPHADPAFAYYWCPVGNSNLYITAKTIDGWEIVYRALPEAEDLPKDEFGRCKIGDVILMRLPLDRYLHLLRIDRAKRRARQDSIESAFEEMGQRYAGRGVRAHTQLSPYMLERGMRMAHAEQIARQQFNSMLREGRVHGMPAPGAPIR